MTTKKKEEKPGITAPKFAISEFQIEGDAPLCQLKFSEKAKNTMLYDMEHPDEAKQNKSKKKREPKNIEEEFKQAMHISEDGWPGFPASSMRKAMISACRLVDFKMTLAKLAIFAEGDGIDKDEGVSLIRINGKAESIISPVRNANGSTDLRTRAIWKKWNSTVCIKYDMTIFSPEDIANLMIRVGCQVGIGEGRPDGKNGAGMGYGTFRVVSKKDYSWYGSKFDNISGLNKTKESGKKTRQARKN